MVYFTEQKVFPPYIYLGIHGSGVGIGGGYPIHPRVYVDGSLSFTRRDAWYSERVGTTISYVPGDTVLRKGTRTDRVIALGISYWFF